MSKYTREEMLAKVKSGANLFLHDLREADPRGTIVIVVEKEGA